MLLILNSNLAYQRRTPAERLRLRIKIRIKSESETGRIQQTLARGVFREHRITDMQTGTSIELSRDCEAVQIPYGSPVLLPRGTSVTITQTLGGTYTIHAQGGLYRIASKDLDALGIDSTASPASDAKLSAAPGELDEQQIWDTLRTCFDPEIPVNIVDLGLIYDMHVEKLPSGSSRVDVKMTLTAPGCGMGTVIARDAQEKLLALALVEEANVEIVWDPPWHQSMISEQGRRILGLE